jgi:hypothetical protein
MTATKKVAESVNIAVANGEEAVTNQRQASLMCLPVFPDLFSAATVLYGAV